MKSWKNILPGLLLALALALGAYQLGKLLPVVGGPVFGITLGILVASILPLPSTLNDGIKFTSKYVLQLAVILLGFEMNMANVIRVGQASLLILVVVTMDFMAQVQNYMMSQQYESLLKKANFKTSLPG